MKDDERRIDEELLREYEAYIVEDLNDQIIKDILISLVKERLTDAS